jgi:O-antigen/teichoic acid export membrane protein
MLATSAASILFLFAVPITQSMMSTFITYSKVNDRHLLFIKYVTCTNFISFILIPFAVNAYFYSDGIIYFWTGNIFLVDSILDAIKQYLLVR